MKYQNGEEVYIGDRVSLDGNQYVVAEVWNDNGLLLRPTKIMNNTIGMTLISHLNKDE